MQPYVSNAKSTSTNYLNADWNTVSSSGSNIFTIDLSKIFPSQKIDSISSPQKQLQFLKNDLGFNISEIASILNATRPSIYSWLENTPPANKTQKRLDEIYNVLFKWETSTLGPINHLSRRKLFENRSLYEFLCDENLNIKALSQCLDIIKKYLIDSKENKKKRDTIYKDNNYLPLSKEESNKTIDNITRKIG